MEWKCALRPLADCANSLVRAANWNVFFSVRSSRFVSSCSPSNVACDVASSCCKPLDHGDIPSFSVTSPTRRPGLMPVGAVLSALGLCSRGEGNYFLKCGLVMLDGRRLEPREAYVHPSAVLSLAPRATRMLKQHKTILLCKPMHYLTCQVDRQVSHKPHRLGYHGGLAGVSNISKWTSISDLGGCLTGQKLLNQASKPFASDLGELCWRELGSSVIWTAF